MRYFDCCCRIGPINEKDPAAPWSVHDVLGWMDRCGIAAALVFHTLSAHGSAVLSRRRLGDEIASAPGRLFPVWPVLPPDAGDFEPAGLLQAMAQEDVRAVKLLPKTHRYPLRPELLEPVLRPLEDRGILTLLDFGELPSELDAAYGLLEAFLAAFPRLPVLLERAPWTAQRLVSALMARRGNLHIEFSNYQVNRGIERYVERFGPERLLFGTGLPEMSPGAARCYIDYAQIPPKAKAMIAGGNLQRLLGDMEIDDVPLPDDPLIALAAAGRPLGDFKPMDAHSHILHEGTDSAGGYVMYRGDGEGLLEMNEILGVQSSAIVSWTGPLASDALDGNDLVARALARHPGRFHGLISLNPVHLGPEAQLAELRRRLEEPGWIGLKPYPRVGLAYDHPLYAPCWQLADEHGLMVLAHIGGKAGPAGSIGKLAEAYPRAQWVIAHSGGSFAMARQVAAVMAEHPNVWAELTLTPVTNGVIEWLVGQVGDERILFGSDAPMRDPRPQLGWVLWADLPLESRRRILGENFRRLLERIKKH